MFLFSSTMNKQSLVEGGLTLLWKLLPGTILNAAKHQLRLQAPILRNVPRGRRLLVRQWVVVLKVATDTLRLEHSPHGVLVHGAGVFRPLGELVGIDLVGLLKLLHWARRFVEKDLSTRIDQ